MKRFLNEIQMMERIETRLAVELAKVSDITDGDLDVLVEKITLDELNGCNKILLKDIYNNKVIEYTEPIYIKRDVYGYLIVSIDKVYFSYCDEDKICIDDISSYYKIL